jgi:hypothetical protein
MPRSVLAILPIGAAESLSRLRGRGLPGAKRRDATVGSALAADLARLQDRGAGGMAPLAPRAPPLALWRAARAVGRGVELRRRGPKGPKEGSRRPERHGPLAASQLRADAAPSYRQRLGCAALLHVRRPAPDRRAPRAFNRRRDSYHHFGQHPLSTP